MIFRSTPVRVSGLTGVIAIAGEESHTITLKSDGTVWAWGNNTSGQLGNGTLTNSSIPVAVSGISGIYQKAIIGTGGEQVAIGDLNADGKPDLAVANWVSNNVSILLNQPASPSAKATILAEPGGEQAVSSKDDSQSAFGCGGIDLHGGGSSGPSDMGGPVSLMAILSLPFIIRRWRRWVMQDAKWDEGGNANFKIQIANCKVRK